MYGKIFETMYDGTLYGQWEAIVTIQQLIVLADESGYVDMTPPALSARTSIPLDIIEKGLKILSEPDLYSRSPKNEGRRIELIDQSRPWGWVIINYKYYRDLASREDKKEKDRKRIAEKRIQNKDVADGRIESTEVANVAYTDTDTDTLSIGHFDLFWEKYPKKVKKKDSRKVWKSKHLDEKIEQIISDITKRTKNDKRWVDGFIPDPTTYLRGERWDDEIEMSVSKDESYVKGGI